MGAQELYCVLVAAYARETHGMTSGQFGKQLSNLRSALRFRMKKTGRVDWHHWNNAHISILTSSRDISQKTWKFNAIYQLLLKCQSSVSWRCFFVVLTQQLGGFPPAKSSHVLSQLRSNLRTELRRRKIKTEQILHPCVEEPLNYDQHHPENHWAWAKGGAFGWKVLTCWWLCCSVRTTMECDEQSGAKRNQLDTCPVAIP